jgi:hypothetical protein
MSAMLHGLGSAHKGTAGSPRGSPKLRVTPCAGAASPRSPAGAGSPCSPAGLPAAPFLARPPHASARQLRCDIRVDTRMSVVARSSSSPTAGTAHAHAAAAAAAAAAPAAAPEAPPAPVAAPQGPTLEAPAAAPSPRPAAAAAAAAPPASQDAAAAAVAAARGDAKFAAALARLDALAASASPAAPSTAVMLECVHLASDGKLTLPVLAAVPAAGGSARLAVLRAALMSTDDVACLAAEVLCRCEGGVRGRRRGCDYGCLALVVAARAQSVVRSSHKGRAPPWALTEPPAPAFATDKNA